MVTLKLLVILNFKIKDKQMNKAFKTNHSNNKLTIESGLFILKFLKGKIPEKTYVHIGHEYNNSNIKLAIDIYSPGGILSILVTPPMYAKELMKICYCMSLELRNIKTNIKRHKIEIRKNEQGI